MAFPYDGGSAGGNTTPNALLNQIAQGVGVTPPQSSSATSNPLWQQLFGTTTPSTVLSGSRVFTGVTEVNVPGEPHRASSNFSTVSDLLRQYYQMSPQQITALGQKLASAGILNPASVGDPMATEQAYEQVLGQLAKMTAADNYVTLDDFLKAYGAQSNKPSSYSTTEKSVNLTDPRSARQLLIQNLQDRLGRNPTPAEYQAFLSSIHAAERENPTVTTRTMKLNNSTGSYDVSNTTTSGGIDPGSFTSDYGTNHNQHEQGAYQAATTYFDALRQAVGAVI